MARLRLHQFREGKPCYFCGAAGPSTAEHAPPKKFFEGSPCTSITVPSCSRHNSEKSGSDCDIKAALVRSVDEVVLNGSRTEVPVTLQRSIQVMQDKYRHASSLVTMQPLIEDAPADLEIRLPFIHKEVAIENWVKMLTAALVWSVTGTHESGSDWENAWIWSPSYFPARRGIPFDMEGIVKEIERIHYTWRNLDEAGTWNAGWQPYPDPFPAALYRFDVCFEATQSTKHVVIFRHLFFGSHLYFTRFTTVASSKQTMFDFLQAEKQNAGDREEETSSLPVPPPRYTKNRRSE